MNIQSFLTRHPHFNYLQRCLRHLNDKDFIAEVLDIGKNPLKIEIERLGDKNPGRLIYIAQTMGCDGFFAELRFILHELYFCECFGMTPVVMMPATSCYCEKFPVNGTTNPFEYYFEPVSDVSLEDAQQSSAVVKHNYYQRMYVLRIYGMNSGYLPTEDYLADMAKLVGRLLRLNAVTAPIIKADIAKMLGGKKTLGVHVRGADFKRRYLNHPNMVSVDEYIARVESTMNGHSFERLFLATDDIEALGKFRSRWGDMVYSYDDVERTSGDETVMRSQNPRPLHHYRLGLEVIRDMYTLAACDGIVAGLSNVSLFANIIRQSRGESFEIMDCINKGVKGK